MPAPRRTASTMDRIEDHREGLRTLLHQVQVAFSDGVGTVAEGAAIATAVTALISQIAGIGIDIQHADATLQLIGTLAATGDPTTTWFRRRTRETAEKLDEMEHDWSASALDDLVAARTLGTPPLAIAAD